MCSALGWCLSAYGSEKPHGNVFAFLSVVVFVAAGGVDLTLPNTIRARIDMNRLMDECVDKCKWSWNVSNRFSCDAILQLHINLFMRKCNHNCD